MTKLEKKLLSLQLKIMRLFPKQIQTVQIKINNSLRAFKYRTDSVGDVGVIKQSLKMKITGFEIFRKEKN